MVKTNEVEQAYQVAKDRYAELGVDTDKVIDELKKVKLSVHCWQGDDIHGFLNPNQELTGGIGVSGDYPGIVTDCPHSPLTGVSDEDTPELAS